MHTDNMLTYDRGVISLLQSQSSLPQGLGADSDPVSKQTPATPCSTTNIVQWPYSDHRCMYACENMAAKIRRMEEDELKHCSPCLILPIFVAARFYIGTYPSMIEFELRHTYFDLL